VTAPHWMDKHSERFGWRYWHTFVFDERDQLTEYVEERRSNGERS
jgi:hypothetical protein